MKKDSLLPAHGCYEFHDLCGALHRFCLEKTMRGVKPGAFECIKMVREPRGGLWGDDTVPGGFEVQARCGEALVGAGIAGSGKAGPLLEGLPVDPGEPADQKCPELAVGKGTEKEILEEGYGKFPDEGFHAGYPGEAADHMPMKRTGKGGAEYSAFDAFWLLMEKSQADKARKGFGHDHDIVRREMPGDEFGVLVERHDLPGGICYHRYGDISRQGFNKRIEKYPGTIDTRHEDYTRLPRHYSRPSSNSMSPELSFPLQYNRKCGRCIMRSTLYNKERSLPKEAVGSCGPPGVPEYIISGDLR